MHSFHQSRGRIFFEVVCALAVSASCVGAWMQTGASALLPAAAVVLLYGLVHAFDMAGQGSVAPTRQTVEFAVAQPADVATEQPVTDEQVPDAGELAEQAAHPARKGRQSKVPRKSGSRRSGASKAAKIAELAPDEESKVVELVPDEKARVAELVPDENPKFTELVPDEEPAGVQPMALDEESHFSLAPLFEPEPFVRQQRTVFGRKSG